MKNKIWFVLICYLFTHTVHAGSFGELAKLTASDAAAGDIFGIRIGVFLVIS